MHWTTTKPTAPGWYWYRTHWAHIVRVYLSDDYDQPTLVAEYGDWFMPVALAGGQWAGPLHPPTDDTRQIPKE